MTRSVSGDGDNADALRERIADLEALNGELEAALTPFAEFGKANVDEDGWNSTIHREQISTWFGPSDFRRAAKLVVQ